MSSYPNKMLEKQTMFGVAIINRAGFLRKLEGVCFAALNVRGPLTITERKFECSLRVRSLEQVSLLLTVDFTVAVKRVALHMPMDIAVIPFLPSTVIHLFTKVNKRTKLHRSLHRYSTIRPYNWGLPTT